MAERADAVGAVARTLLGLVFGVEIAASQDPVAGWLVNGGGEIGAVLRKGDADGVTGWTAVRGAWIAQRAPWSKIEASAGKAFLRPIAGDDPELEQVVGLAEGGAPRPRALLLTADLRTSRGKDRAGLRLELLDAAGDVIAAIDSGDRAEASWTSIALATGVPKEAVSARVALRGVRNDGEFADALFDEVELCDFGPGRPSGFAGLPSERLLGFVDGDDAPARRAAARALAVDPRTQRPLLDRARATTDRARKRDLAGALALSGSNLAADPLADLLRSQDDGDVEFALALLPVAGVDAGKLVAPLLQAGSAAPMRRAAIRALGTIGKGEALRALQKLCKGEVSDRVLVLGVLRESHVAVEPLYRALLVPALADDVEAPVRREAMRLLGEARDARFLTHFAQLARKEDSPEVLSQWFRFAAAIDGERAMATILELLDVRTALAERALLSAAAKLSAKSAREWARRKGLADDSANLRRAALRILAREATVGDLPAFVASCADADPIVAVEAVEAVVACPGEAARQALDSLVERAPGVVAAAALRGLATRGDGVASLPARLDAARSRSDAFEVRVAAVELLPLDDAQRALAILSGTLIDPQWQVRAASCRRLSALRRRESVELLIGRLDQESGPATTYLCDALAALCGVDQGDDPAAWRRWWDIVAKDFVVAADPPKQKTARPTTSTEYWGIPIRGRNLVFVLDLSGSMNTALDGKTRLAVAKQRLVEVLRALDAQQRFAVVAFGSEVEPFERELLPASKDNVERAAKWIDRLAVHGSTNIYDSLEFALAMSGVEAVYLLTDGAPSSGKLIDMDEIRRAVRSQNAERLVRVNTIQIGGGRRETSFLRGLAAENHGESRSR